MEIRRAIAVGTIKPKNNEKKGKGLSKFTDMFNKAASAKLANSERIRELLAAMKAHKDRILEHILKEQDFSNEQPIIEKNELLLEKMAKT